MITESDIARRDALVELMSRQDDFDHLRRSRVVAEGSPVRHELVQKLAATYIQATLLEIEEARRERRMAADELHIRKTVPRTETRQEEAFTFSGLFRGFAARSLACSASLACVVSRQGHRFLLSSGSSLLPR